MLTDTIFFFFSCNTPSLIDNLTQQLWLISTGQLVTDLLQFNLSAHNKTILHIERKIKTLHLKFPFLVVQGGQFLSKLFVHTSSTLPLKVQLYYFVSLRKISAPLLLNPGSVPEHSNITKQQQNHWVERLALKERSRNCHMGQNVG